MPIMRWLRRSANSEKGQTLILVAVVFVALLGLGAMAVDVGGVLWSRGAEQNAADAAALAGVRSLPGSPDVAQQVALDYAASNGFPNGVDGVTVTTKVGNLNDIDPTINDPNSNDTLTVTITRTVQPGLRAAVGGGNIDVPAQAIAVVAPVTPQCGIWPWGVDATAAWTYNNYISGNSTTTDITNTYGQEVVLKVPSPTTPGNFYAIQLETSKNGGAQEYENAIKLGGCLPLDQSTYTASKTGDMVGPTQQGVEQTVNGNGNQITGAIITCASCWAPNSGQPAPDNVFWAVSPNKTSVSPGPFTNTGQYRDPTTDALIKNADGSWPTTTTAFGIGMPCPGPDPSTGPCAGPPSQDDPFPIPAVNWDATQNKNLCPRVGIVPIVDPNTWQTQNGSSGTIKIIGYAAFYLIGLIEGQGNQAYVVGAYLPEVKVEGSADYGGELNGPVNYFLWK